MTVLRTSYAKTVVAVLAAVAAAVLPGLVTDGPLDLVWAANLVVLAAGAVQVYSAPNTPTWKFAKAAAAGIAAGGVLVISAWSDSLITSSEWTQIAAAVLGAILVGAVPNAGTDDGVFVAGRHALGRAG